MSTGNAGDEVDVYSGAFVLAAYTEIICVDNTVDGNLAGYSVQIMYYPHENATPIQWPIGTITPVTYGSPDQPIVKALIVPVVPILPPEDTIRQLVSSFLKTSIPNDPVGSGMLMGSLSPPPPSIPDVETTEGSAVMGKTKTFKITGPVIYAGIKID